MATQEVEYPRSLIGIISLDVIRDPVLASDGYTYERKLIQRWFNQGKTTSPMGGLLPTTVLRPNRALKSIIEAEAVRNNDLPLLEELKAAASAATLAEQKQQQDAEEAQAEKERVERAEAARQAQVAAARERFPFNNHGGRRKRKKTRKRIKRKKGKKRRKSQKRR